MTSYRQLSQTELKAELAALREAYEAFQARDLHLDMSRGKPGTEQLDLSMPMFDILDSASELYDKNGADARNYGLLDGIPEAKKLFSKVLNVSSEEIIVGGNSSLNMMYDTIVRGMLFGFLESPKPWKDCEKIKFLCPSPGYDRHFAICEQMGIEMVTIPMTATGPDMDLVEQYVSEDEAVKGIWCVPMYSNPQGITYSEETVRRFAHLKPAAKDFKIFWDNAYCMHHLTDTPDVLLDLFAESKQVGTEDRVLMFTSTSKISFAGAGIATLASSKRNIEYFKKLMNVQIISYDKIAQYRHVRFFRNLDNMKAHMKLHRAILQPKFGIVLDRLEQEIAPLEIAEWTRPHGGYFIAVDTMDGCANRVVSLCREAGVVLTGAGATFPYGKDPHDRNIRLAPTYPSCQELEQATELFCLCLKIASVEKLLAEK